MNMPVSLVVLMILLYACQGNSPTNNPSESPTAQSSATASSMPIPGGEMAQKTDSPQAKAMLINAQNLLNQKYPDAAIVLGTIKSYTTQVVAGSNHRLEADYTNKAGQKGSVKVTIYQDLNGTLALTEENYPAKK